MYELIYTCDGVQKKVYPQTAQRAKSLVENIRRNQKRYSLISCVECRNEDAYDRGAAEILEFVMQETGVITSDDITEEQWDTVIERVLDAPFEYDQDVAYYIICENEGFAAANNFYREVTA